MLEYRGLPFFLSPHHHNISPHLYIVLILLRIVYIVNHPVDGYLRLFLLHFRVVPYNTLTFIRMSKAVVYHSVRYAEF